MNCGTYDQGGFIKNLVLKVKIVIENPEYYW